MEENGNQNLASFCRNGCGFYAAQAFDGMCSKCYKHLKHLPESGSCVTTLQSPAATTSVGRSSLLDAGGDDVDMDVVAAAMGKTSLGGESMDLLVS